MYCKNYHEVNYQHLRNGYETFHKKPFYTGKRSTHKTKENPTTFILKHATCKEFLLRFMENKQNGYFFICENRGVLNLYCTVGTSFGRLGPFPISTYVEQLLLFLAKLKPI